MASDLVISNLRGAIVGPVDLKVAPGACASISGPSGAGKTLFLRMIADLDQNEGDVHLGDTSRANLPAPDWRRQVTYVAAESGWWADKVDAHFPSATHADAKTMAVQLGLAEAQFGRAVATLSTGERQRFALIRALVRNPSVLLLDEPTAALDAAGIDRVEKLIRTALGNGLILVLVSHDPAQAQRLGAERYAMHAGRLAAA